MTEKMNGRIQLPWKVYFENAHAGATRYRDGREARTTSRHFATKDEALTFAGGNEKLVLYRPGEAWRHAENEDARIVRLQSEGRILGPWNPDNTNNW